MKQPSRVKRIVIIIIILITFYLLSSTKHYEHDCLEGDGGYCYTIAYIYWGDVTGNDWLLGIKLTQNIDRGNL